MAVARNACAATEQIIESVAAGESAAAAAVGVLIGVDTDTAAALEASRAGNAIAARHALAVVADATIGVAIRLLVTAEALVFGWCTHAVDTVVTSWAICRALTAHGVTIAGIAGIAGIATVNGRVTAGVVFEAVETELTVLVGQAFDTHVAAEVAKHTHGAVVGRVTGGSWYFTLVEVICDADAVCTGRPRDTVSTRLTDGSTVDAFFPHALGVVVASTSWAATTFDGHNQ